MACIVRLIQRSEFVWVASRRLCVWCFWTDHKLEHSLAIETQGCVMIDCEMWSFSRHTDRSNTGFWTAEQGVRYLPGYSTFARWMPYTVIFVTGLGWLLDNLFWPCMWMWFPTCDVNKKNAWLFFFSKRISVEQINIWLFWIGSAAFESGQIFMCHYKKIVIWMGKKYYIIYDHLHDAFCQLEWTYLLFFIKY